MNESLFDQITIKQICSAFYSFQSEISSMSGFLDVLFDIPFCEDETEKKKWIKAYSALNQPDVLINIRDRALNPASQISLSNNVSRLLDIVSHKGVFILQLISRARARFVGMDSLLELKKFSDVIANSSDSAEYDKATNESFFILIRHALSCPQFIEKNHEEKIKQCALIFNCNEPQRYELLSVCSDEDSLLISADWFSNNNNPIKAAQIYYSGSRFVSCTIDMALFLIKTKRLNLQGKISNSEMEQVYGIIKPVEEKIRKIIREKPDLYSDIHCVSSRFEEFLTAFKVLFVYSLKDEKELLRGMAANSVITLIENKEIDFNNDEAKTRVINTLEAICAQYCDFNWLQKKCTRRINNLLVFKTESLPGSGGENELPPEVYEQFNADLESLSFFPIQKYNALRLRYLRSIQFKEPFDLDELDKLKSIIAEMPPNSPYRKYASDFYNQLIDEFKNRVNSLKKMPVNS